MIINQRFKTTLLASAVGLAALAASSTAFAAATIINPADTVALGVNDQGHLNTFTGNVAVNAGATGLAFKFPDGSFRDATSPGCLCEGWGVSANNSVSGSANVDVGSVQNLTVDSFASTATTATSSVHLTSLPGLSVTHHYAPSAVTPDVFFKGTVTIANNTGADINDLKYVRVMDWDIPTTEFAEFVTIKGTASTTLLEKSHLNGFASANPLDTSCDATGCGYGGVDVDVTDAGPTDHGAYFRFNFGTLANGASYVFDIFYGAAGSEAAMLAAIAAEGLELFSLGQSSTTDGPTLGTPATFAFGFKGVGGTAVIPPNNVPEPTTLALMGLGFFGLAGFRRRQAVGKAC